jgi:hypothetical protein
MHDDTSRKLLAPDNPEYNSLNFAYMIGLDGEDGFLYLMGCGSAPCGYHYHYQSCPN